MQLMKNKSIPILIKKEEEKKVSFIEFQINEVLRSEIGMIWSEIWRRNWGYEIEKII